MNLCENTIKPSRGNIFTPILPSLAANFRGVNLWLFSIASNWTFFPWSLLCWMRISSYILSIISVFSVVLSAMTTKACKVVFPCESLSVRSALVYGLSMRKDTMSGWLVQAARDKGSSPVQERGVFFSHQVCKCSLWVYLLGDLITHQNKSPVRLYAGRSSRWLWLAHLLLSGRAASRGQSFFSRWRCAALSDLWGGLLQETSCNVFLHTVTLSCLRFKLLVCLGILWRNAHDSEIWFCSTYGRFNVSIFN